MSLSLIAVEDCTIEDTLHKGTCTIKSGLSKKAKVANKKVLLDG